jgi:hypothetical protein
MSDNLERVLSEGRQVLELAGLYERFCEDTRQRLSRTAATIVDLYYSSVAESQEKKKTRYFAEKSLPFFLPNISRDLYGWKAKEILVVRDPRDIFCSATQFNKKRGTSAFSASYYEKDTAWFRFLCHSFVHVANRHHRLGAEALTIRYEDLILDERNAISKIMRFLQVCDDDATLAAIQDRIRQAGDVFSDHKTSTTPRHSVSRWRSYEDKNIFTFEDKQYLESMRMFGYL